jgi:hypothetical protein
VSRRVSYLRRWFVVVASLSEFDDAVTVVVSTLIVALVAAIILLKTLVFC